MPPAEILGAGGEVLSSLQKDGHLYKREFEVDGERGFVEVEASPGSAYIRRGWYCSCCGGENPRRTNYDYISIGSKREISKGVTAVAVKNSRSLP